MKVIGRQARDARQCLQFERIVKMLSDVFDGGLNGSFVEGAGVGLHGSFTVAGAADSVLDIGCGFRAFRERLVRDRFPSSIVAARTNGAIMRPPMRVAEGRSRRHERPILRDMCDVR